MTSMRDITKAVLTGTILTAITLRTLGCIDQKLRGAPNKHL
jgi:hypothetical protein